jgi:hypothetical protein
MPDQRSRYVGKFSGLSFGISVSASDAEIGDIPFTADDVYRLTLQEATYVLREGGRLVLGHQWRTEGVMHQLAVKAHDLRTWQSSASSEPEQPAILNVIAWPDQPPPAHDSTVRKLMQNRVMTVEQMLPPGIDVSAIENGSEEALFCRIRALTEMRQRITELSDVRLCIGGAKGKPQQRLPGILEEALLTINAGKPLYITSALGGISKLIADALLQRHIPEQLRSNFYTPDESRDIMLKMSAAHPFPSEFGPAIPGPAGKFHRDPLEDLQNCSIDTLAEIARLSTDDYIVMLTTANLDRALTFVTRGAVQIAREHSDPDHPATP